MLRSSIRFLSTVVREAPAPRMPGFVPSPSKRARTVHILHTHSRRSRSKKMAPACAQPHHDSFLTLASACIFPLSSCRHRQSAQLPFSQTRSAGGVQEDPGRQQKVFGPARKEPVQVPDEVVKREDEEARPTRDADLWMLSKASQRTASRIRSPISSDAELGDSKFQGPRCSCKLTGW